MPPRRARPSRSAWSEFVSTTKRVGWLVLIAGLVGACGGGDGGDTKPGPDPQPDPAALPARLSLEKLMDPETCKGCHPKHYEEWSGSMHAYAAVDPVFNAMNKRGQRETSGQLGKFCVQCHA